MTQAETIRAEMRSMRRALAQEQQRQAGEAVCSRIKALDVYAASHCVMAYMACGGELPLDDLVRDILSDGKMLLLPRCEQPGQMTARRVDALDQLAAGMYGIMEPDETCEIIQPGYIDLILVPGTAFDVSGRRIGQGGGYYDRFLPHTKAYTIGICYDFALFAQIPAQAHDRNVDAVITPTRMIDLSGK